MDSEGIPISLLILVVCVQVHARACPDATCVTRDARSVCGPYCMYPPHCADLKQKRFLTPAVLWGQPFCTSGLGLVQVPMCVIRVIRVIHMIRVIRVIRVIHVIHVIHVSTYPHCAHLTPAFMHSMKEWGLRHQFYPSTPKGQHPGKLAALCNLLQGTIIGPSLARTHHCGAALTCNHIRPSILTHKSLQPHTQARIFTLDMLIVEASLGEKERNFSQHDPISHLSDHRHRVRVGEKHQTQNPPRIYSEMCVREGEREKKA